MTTYIVACGKEKAQFRMQAKDMYIGSYFKSCLKYALEFGDKVFILSAKYGLLELDDFINPYDLLMGDDGSVTIDIVKEQAINLEISGNVIVLGGKKYLDFSKKIWKNATCPLSGGLLHQISWMNQQVDIQNKKRQLELWK